MYLVQTKGTSLEEAEGAGSLGCRQTRAMGRKSMGRAMRGGGDGAVVDMHRLTVHVEWDVTLEAGASKRHQGSMREHKKAWGMSAEEQC